MGTLTAVVTGFSGLADALSMTGHFQHVYSLSTTSELRDLIRDGRLPNDKSQVIFLFADTTKVDTPQTLDILTSKLTSTGWRVIILGLTPRATDLVSANPGAGLLNGPFTANIALGAISGLTGTFLDPVESGFVDIDPAPAINAIFDRPVVQGAPSGFATPGASIPPATPAPIPTPVTPAAAGGGWSRPSEDPSDVRPAPRPAPFTPTAPPQPAAPQPAPFTPAQPVVPAAPFTPAQPTPQPTPFAPAPAAPATPFGAPDPFARTTPPAPPVDQSYGETSIQPVVRPVPQRDMSGGYGTPGTFVAPGARPLVPREGSGGLVRMPDAGQTSTYGDYAGAGRRMARVICVTSPKGGTGKSTLTLNMAAYMALRVKPYGKRVCVIDANFQQADAGKMLGQYSPNITNIIKDTASLAPNAIERYLVRREDLNLSVLLGPSMPEEANPQYLNARLYNQVLDALRPNFDYIFIDTPVAEVYHDLFRGFVLPAADYIIVPLTPVLHTIMNVDAWLHTVTLPRHTGGDDVDPNKVGIVLNQAEDGVDIGEVEIRRELSKWHFIGSVPRSKAWINAVNNYEMVATKNYHELNDSFSRILYFATGEEALLVGIAQGAPQVSTGGRRGLLGRLFGGRR